MITGIGFSIILFAHWFTDFFLQNDWMALNKSDDVRILSVHCAIYSIGMSMVMVFIMPFFWFTPLILFTTHMVIDFVGSKVCAYLYQKGKRHWFFVTIGFDQFLHLAILSILFFP